MRTILHMAMVGGGPGSFIGPVHRMAAELGGRIRLVAGAFSSDADRSREAAISYGLPAERGYADISALLAGETPGDLDFVAIVTPNHLHLPTAEAALRAGIPVLCDKPATANLSEALRLREAVRTSGRAYGLTHSYTGYPMLRQARAMVADGAIGPPRKLVVGYSQGWLADRVEERGSKQANWRTDPAQAGVGGCIADIGVHAFNLAEYVAGEQVEMLCADLSRLVPGRQLDDDANLLLRFAGGWPGVLYASQAATGDRNGLVLHLWGTDGGLHWTHARPDRLTWERTDAPTQILHAAAPYLVPMARGASRLPMGHPEGFIEAFANLYETFADVLGGATGILDGILPGIEAGVRGMAFIETAVVSSAARAWRTIEVPA